MAMASPEITDSEFKFADSFSASFLPDDASLFLKYCGGARLARLPLTTITHVHAHDDLVVVGLPAMNCDCGNDDCGLGRLASFAFHAPHSVAAAFATWFAALPGARSTCCV